MVDHHGVRTRRDAGEKAFRVGDRQQRRYGDYRLDTGCLQLRGRSEALFYGTGVRRQSRQPLAVGFDGQVHAQLAMPLQLPQQVAIPGDLVGVGLHDQQVGRLLRHRLQQPAGDAVARLLRRERLGRAGQEDAEGAAGAPRPAPFPDDGGAIGRRRVVAHLQERAPGAPAGHVAIVAHVAAGAAQGVPERTAAVGLRRVRRHGAQETAAAGEDVADLGDGYLHVRVVFRASADSDPRPGGRLPPAARRHARRRPRRRVARGPQTGPRRFAGRGRLPAMRRAPFDSAGDDAGAAPPGRAPLQLRAAAPVNRPDDTLAARDGTRRRTESGVAPGWQSATTSISATCERGARQPAGMYRRIQCSRCPATGCQPSPRHTSSGWRRSAIGNATRAPVICAA